LGAPLLAQDASYFAASANTSSFLSSSTLPSLLYECTVLYVGGTLVQANFPRRRGV
jgi:hypothetical protein